MLKKIIKKFRENQVFIKFFVVITESNNSKRNQYLPNSGINQDTVTRVEAVGLLTCISKP
jgi:hypothetical protein